MIRVPSITIVRPWPAALGRRRATTPERLSDQAERELARRRMMAMMSIEREAMFSAQFNGRKLF